MPTSDPCFDLSARPLADGLLDLIGRTPLVELRSFQPREGVKLYAKLEGQNPSGSVKDRIARALIERAEAEGRLKPGGTIIEASSGNTGIAVGLVGKRKGYRVVVVVPREIPPTILDVMRLLGVEILHCEACAGLAGAIRQAERLAEERGYCALRQFDSPVNVETHRDGTGQELLRALPQVDAFVAGIGTGGTLMGVGRRLRAHNPAVKLIGVSPKHGERLQGLRDLSHGYELPLLDLDLLDARYMVDNATALNMTRRIVEQEGILGGVSCGACLHAALRYAERLTSGNMVVMFPDGAWKYLPARPWESALNHDTLLDEFHWW